MHARQYEPESEIVFGAGIDAMQGKHALNIGADGGQIQMQRFDWLVAMNEVNFSFLDEAAQLRNEFRINRQAPLKADELHAGITEFRRQIPTRGGYKSEVQALSSGVPAKIQFHDLGPASV